MRGASHGRSRYRERIGTALFVYAHPDDESALLTLTRGDVGGLRASPKATDISAYRERKAKAFECARGGREFFPLAIDRGAPVPAAGDLFV